MNLRHDSFVFSEISKMRILMARTGCINFNGIGPVFISLRLSLGNTKWRQNSR